MGNSEKLHLNKVFSKSKENNILIKRSKLLMVDVKVNYTQMILPLLNEYLQLGVRENELQNQSN